MKEIKFRGKRIDNGEWEYGTPVVGCMSGVFIVWVKLQTKDWAIKDKLMTAEVDPDTVGQYTGLRDKHGQEVYEGDILSYREVIYTDCSQTEIKEIRDPVLIGIVLHTPLVTVIKPYSKKVRAFGWDRERGEGFLLGLRSEEIEKVGNIFENPELLELTKQPQ